ncbi:hypothetical protein EXIGLDRAFT_716416 [Exidia glandulosa HHB12029]|uniref:F-box domain-containing protein n=1 Tax=Exidia glandulosa HHB12029 TaxID=1314781 RepID=A0A165R3V2_EXIGL|nr:hypothetical protein EXIGLDRAFT_716416 [Exidia glandulosa HHB12029]
MDAVDSSCTHPRSFFTSLPPELLYTILVHLDVKDRRNATLCCRDIRNIALAYPSRIWSHIVARGGSACRTLTEQLRCSNGTPVSVLLSPPYDVLADAMLAIQRHLHSVRSLVIDTKDPVMGRTLEPCELDTILDALCRGQAPMLDSFELVLYTGDHLQQDVRRVPRHIFMCHAPQLTRVSLSGEVDRLSDAKPSCALQGCPCACAGQRRAS